MFSDICALPQVQGGCSDYSLWYHYNSTDDTCSMFYYGGCDGNANRYMTEELCDTACRGAAKADIGKRHQLLCH